MPFVQASPTAGRPGSTPAAPSGTTGAGGTSLTGAAVPAGGALSGALAGTVSRGVPPLGRIPVLDVAPNVNGGRWPVKAVVGEAVPVTATVFREGHDAVAASAVLIDPDGARHSVVRMTPGAPGSDSWSATLVPDRTGAWTYLVEGWSDPYGTWEHDATIKVHAGVDVELMLEEGARLLERASARPEFAPEAAYALMDAVAAIRDETATPPSA